MKQVECFKGPKAVHLKTLLAPRQVSDVGSCRHFGTSLRDVHSKATASQFSSTSYRQTLTEDFEVVCPICQRTSFKVKPYASKSSQEQLHCSRCGRGYVTNATFTDLTLDALPGAEFQERYTGGVQIFRSPVVSYIYERGWRQGFSGFGFPGERVETGYALDYMQPAWGETIMDLSCGSGLFSRQFIKSGKFKNVIAADFSENMLKQTSRFIQEDQSIDRGKYTLLRLDAGRLPFETGSLAAIHAGAAMHCWPNPALAVAEISRVLRPGGVYVASTILNVSSGLGSLVGDDILKPLKRIGAFNVLDESQTTAYKFWNEQELREICSRMGLKGWQQKRNLRFIMFSVQKPSY